VPTSQHFSGSVPGRCVSALRVDFGLGGAEFRLSLLIGVFRFAALRAVILNKVMSLVVVASAFRAGPSVEVTCRAPRSPRLTRTFVSFALLYRLGPVLHHRSGNEQHVLIAATAAQPIHTEQNHADVAACVAFTGAYTIKRWNCRAIGDCAAAPEWQTTDCAHGNPRWGAGTLYAAFVLLVPQKQKSCNHDRDSE
jgi:hypothetical protein